MANLSLNIEAIRVQMGVTRVEMAEKMNISIDRYNRLASGDSKMLAAELVSLHQISGVPYENIKVISYIPRKRGIRNGEISKNN